MKQYFSKFMVLGAAVLATAVLAGGVPAEAQTNAGEPTRGPMSAGSPNIIAPYAQALALVQGGALTSAKGFTAFAHPGVGLYCLTLPSGMSYTTEPVVSIEWAASLGVALFAQYDRNNIDCPGATARTIAVRTYKGDTGGVGSSLQIPVLSDSVAFIVLVP